VLPSSCLLPDVPSERELPGEAEVILGRRDTIDVMLQLVDVQKSLGGKLVLRALELEVAAGQTVVVLGPSGCGKSTLIRLMNGLLVPDTGEVFFDGESLDEGNMLASRRRMGYVIQGGGLFPHLTARQNMTLVARHVARHVAHHVAHHVRREDTAIESRVEELRVLTKFPADGLDRYPRELSGGQRQRVSLMRALFLDPELLLLDEPLGALDPMIRNELQKDLRGIFRELGKTVVLVTHDLAEAAYFADVVLLMRDGAVVQRGSFAELLRHPADEFVTQFVNAQRVDWMEETRG
jgi:osmoprotectant transport system ATP-binding protein